MYGPESPELRSLSTVFEPEDDEELEASEDSLDLESDEISAVLRKSLHPGAPEATHGDWLRLGIENGAG